MKLCTWRLRRLVAPVGVISVALSAVLFVGALAGCDKKGTTTAPESTAPTYETALQIILKGEPTAAEDYLLSQLPGEVWASIEEFFRSNPGVSPYVGTSPTPVGAAMPATGCAWDGTTERDEGICVARGYKFQGHNAVYFVVDGSADCYDKSIREPWIQCSPGSGCVSEWQLQCSDANCAWWWHRGLQKWVKTVHLLVPTAWWWYYVPYPADWKAQAFRVSWNDTRQAGCCE